MAEYVGVVEEELGLPGLLGLSVREDGGGQQANDEYARLLIRVG